MLANLFVFLLFISLLAVQFTGPRLGRNLYILSILLPVFTKSIRKISQRVYAAKSSSQWPTESLRGESPWLGRNVMAAEGQHRKSTSGPEIKGEEINGMGREGKRRERRGRNSRTSSVRMCPFKSLHSGSPRKTLHGLYEWSEARAPRCGSSICHTITSFCFSFLKCEK